MNEEHSPLRACGAPALASTNTGDGSPSSAAGASGRIVPQVVTDRPPRPEQMAREAMSLPPEWAVYQWSREGKHPEYWGLTVKGGIAPLKTRGKNKGRRNWDAATMLRTFTVTDQQFDAWLAAWSRDTGYCHHCEGTGHAWAGWHYETGSRYRPCRPCGATGRAAIAIAERGAAPDNTYESRKHEGEAEVTNTLEGHQ